MKKKKSHDWSSVAIWLLVMYIIVLQYFTFRLNLIVSNNTKHLINQQRIIISMWDIIDNNTYDVICMQSNIEEILRYLDMHPTL